MDDILAQMPDFADENDPRANRITTEVKRLRTKRRDASQDQRSRKLQAREDEVEERERAQNRRDRDGVERLERQRVRTRTLQARLDKQTEAIILFRRRLVVGILAFTLVGLLAGALYLQLWLTAFLALATLVVLIHQGWDWMTVRKSSWKRLLVVIGAELFTVASSALAIPR
jgi:uncharacterized membrane protein (DUF106 family)